jgi:hypothetical protein
MGSVVCGALTRSGMLCRSLAVTSSKRCRLHGGMSTGPTSVIGKLRSGARLQLYRITDGGRGKPKTDKARRKREAATKRRMAWLEQQDKKRAREEKWRRRKAIESGLPLIDMNKLGEE